jgi:hypothetical protein
VCRRADLPMSAYVILGTWSFLIGGPRVVVGSSGT